MRGVSASIPAIDIQPDHWEIVRHILHRYVPQYGVWAFGSRAKWTAKTYSDLDLAIITDEALPLPISAAIADAFSESNLPWKVDVVDWAATSQSFRKVIERDKVVVQESKPTSNPSSDWSITCIEDIAEKIAMGPFGSSIKVETFVDDGVPVISGAHLRSVRVEDGDFSFITDDHAEKLKNSNVRRGDVIFTHAGNIGQVAYIPTDSRYARYVISQRQFYLRCNERADPAFITYYFHSGKGQHQLLANASQVGVPSIARPSSYLKTIELALPPIDEQRAIAHILGTLDDKIELNRKQNEALEAMARALFKAWFVDFEPVRAKLEGRWQRGQSLPGLPAHLYDLFPDRLVDSELGEIPEGWETKKIEGLITRLAVGKKYEQKTVFAEGCVPVLDQGKTGVIGYHNNQPDVIATADKPVVVFANHTCYMRLINFPFSAIQNVLPFIGNDISTIWVFYASLGKQPFVEYKGHWPDFVLHEVPTPSPKLAEEFEKIAHSNLRSIWQNERESRSLAQLRDTLLPKLISGELRVPDAEAFLKERGL